LKSLTDKYSYLFYIWWYQTGGKSSATMQGAGVEFFGLKVRQVKI